MLRTGFDPARLWRPCDAWLSRCRARRLQGRFIAFRYWQFRPRALHCCARLSWLLESSIRSACR